jgi:FimV-like protein
MKWTVVFVCLLVPALAAFPDQKADYQKLLEQKRYPELLQLLTAWEQSDPTNPEVYIGYINYYLTVGRIEGVSLDRTAKQGATVLRLTDPNTGETVGYMNPAVFYDDKDVAAGLGKLNEGLKYGPDRLDMYFGKIYILNEVLDYGTAGKTLVDVLNRSALNGNKWLWSDNKPVQDGQDFLLNNIQDYYSKWLDARSKESLDAVQQACSVQIKLYPDHIYAYNDIGYSFALRADYKTALGYFLQSERIDPTDLLVVNNIAQTYVRMGDKGKAKEYYGKILKFGSDAQKKQAQEQIDRL